MLDCFGQCSLNQWPGARYLSTHNHCFRTEADNQVRNSDAEATSSFNESGFSVGLTCQRLVHQVSEIKRSPIFAARQFHIASQSCALRRKGFPAVAITA